MAQRIQFRRYIGLYLIQMLAQLTVTAFHQRRHMIQRFLPIVRHRQCGGLEVINAGVQFFIHHYHGSHWCFRHRLVGLLRQFAGDIKHRLHQHGQLGQFLTERLMAALEGIDVQLLAFQSADQLLGFAGAVVNVHQLMSLGLQRALQVVQHQCGIVQQGVVFKGFFVNHLKLAQCHQLLFAYRGQRFGEPVWQHLVGLSLAIDHRGDGFFQHPDFTVELMKVGAHIRQHTLGRFAHFHQCVVVMGEVALNAVAYLVGGFTKRRHRVAGEGFDQFLLTTVIIRQQILNTGIAGCRFAEGQLLQFQRTLGQVAIHLYAGADLFAVAGEVREVNFKVILHFTDHVFEAVAAFVVVLMLGLGQLIQTALQLAHPGIGQDQQHHHAQQGRALQGQRK